MNQLLKALVDTVLPLGAPRDSEVRSSTSRLEAGKRGVYPLLPRL